MNENDDTQHDSDKHNELLSIYDPNDEMAKDDENESKHSNHLHLTL